MKTPDGCDHCYNGQIAVDEASQKIVATGLNHCAADKRGAEERLPDRTRRGAGLRQRTYGGTQTIYFAERGTESFKGAALDPR